MADVPILVGVGSLWFKGPLRLGTNGIAVPAGSLWFDGPADTDTVVGGAVTCAPDTAALQWSGHGPVFGASPTLAVGVAALAMAGTFVAVAFIGPETGGLALSGHQPVAAVSGQTVLAPDPSALSVTGYAPQALQVGVVQPFVGTLTLAGHAPTIPQTLQDLSPILSPATCELAWTGRAPVSVGGAYNQIQLLVGGEDATARWKLGNLTIEERLGARTVCRGVLISKDGSYRPSMFDEVRVVHQGAILFVGRITSTSEAPLVDKTGAGTTFTATDSSLYCDRFVVRNVTYTDQPLKTILEDLQAHYLGVFGITIHADQPTGPTVTATFDYISVTDALNHLSTLTGYVWRVDSSSRLLMQLPASGATPVTLTSANSTLLLRPQAAQDLTDYRNHQLIRYAEGTLVVAEQDATEIAANGVFEAFADAPEITTEADARALAQSLIRRYGYVQRIATVRTLQTGFHVGQQGVITIPEHNVSGSHLIQAVTYRNTGVVATPWIVELEAVSGGERLSDWVDQWRMLLGGTTALSGSVSFVGGGGSSQAMTFAAHLGGSRVVDIRPTPTAPVPDYVDVLLDSSKFVSTPLTVRVDVRTRSASTSVQPQVMNVTDGVVAASGSVTVSTSWESQSFSLPLATGVKKYRLYLVAGNGAVGVQGIGGIYAS
jgi:hypothetical protein